jgi:hypothetical protein
MSGRGAKVGGWVAELVLIFLGAYAAFWLTNYQQHRQDMRRHDQILAALESEVSEAMANAHSEAEREGKVVDEFRRALDAGEMPVLRPFTFSSDYSATDIATLLQSGGYELLDVKTLLALRNAESALRGGLSRMKHFQDLSDVLIVPNLDQDSSFFYDPATKKLRKRFAAYPEALQATVQLFREWEKTEGDLLRQIQVERSGH